MAQEQWSIYERWYGRDEPPLQVIHLRAGDLTAEFEGGDLRYLRSGDQELVRRVYVAVRDHNWNTIPGQISNLEVKTAADCFQISYLCVHKAGSIDFRWQARLEGQADGTVSFALEGAAGSAFRYNRIGFCVLHPVQGIAGQPYRAVTPAGVVSGSLPELVGPQLIKNGFEAPIFPSCSSLSITLADGVKLVTDFEGDLFEMEDQRNWTDGSFKTYCTPLSLGYPYQAQPGQAFIQKIMIRLESVGQLALKAASPQDETVRLVIGGDTGQRLPRLGFSLRLSEEALIEREIGLIARLRPDHLKTELHLRNPTWPAQLEKAGQAVRQIGSPLELALFLDDNTEEALAQAASRLAGIDLARVIVFHEAEAARVPTSACWMELARSILGPARPGLQFVGGTNGNFSELNRKPPDTALMDAVSYTLNPQVHSFDERSLIEGIEAQRDTVISADRITRRPVVVSSVTLKPPFNQAAKEEEGPGDPNQLPTPVDRRQMSLFAAAWTVGSLQSLTAGGASSITYYETTGWRGLLETDQGNRLPALFRSFPGMVFPVYWVFTHLAEAKGAVLLETRSANPLLVGALALRNGNRVWLLAANYQPKDQEVYLSGLRAGQVVRLRLNEDTFAAAAAGPEIFLALAAPVQSGGSPPGELSLHLKPYETSLLAINLTE